MSSFAVCAVHGILIHIWTALILFSICDEIVQHLLPYMKMEFTKHPVLFSLPLSTFTDFWTIFLASERHLLPFLCVSWSQYRIFHCPSLYFPNSWIYAPVWSLHRLSAARSLDSHFCWQHFVFLQFTANPFFWLSLFRSSCSFFCKSVMNTVSSAYHRLLMLCPPTINLENLSNSGKIISL